MENSERLAAGLRVRIKADRKNARGKRVRFSAALRADVVSFAEATKFTQAQLARELTLSETAVGRWLNAVGSESGTKLRRVKIVTEPPSRGAQAEGLVLELPGGGRVVGLSLEQVRSLL